MEEERNRSSLLEEELYRLECEVISPARLCLTVGGFQLENRTEIEQQMMQNSEEIEQQMMQELQKQQQGVVTFLSTLAHQLLTCLVQAAAVLYSECLTADSASVPLIGAITANSRRAQNTRGSKGKNATVGQVTTSDGRTFPDTYKGARLLE